MEIARNVHLVPGLRLSNACLVTAPEVVLFDAGLPGDGPAVLDYLRRLGLGPGDLRAVVLTHADPSHAGGAPWLRRNTAARIWASAIEAEACAGTRPRGLLRWLWGHALAAAGRPPERFAVDGILSPGDEVAGFVAVATPGHTEGHLAFFRPDDGVLLAGDAVRVSGRDILAPAFWDAYSEVQARVSIARLADLPVHLLVPGHGPPYREPGAGLRLAGGPPGFLEEQLRRRAAARERRRGRAAG
jgi:glyoxylase-like metal-dependent hydrolase (beta-lactamase superfamily II)